MRQPPLLFVTAMASLLLRCSESLTQTPTPSQTSTPLGAVFFDGTASQTAPFNTANATVINSSWMFAVSFTVSEADPACGPGRYSLSQVWLALSQGNGGASVNVQVQVFRADVSVGVWKCWRGKVICLGITCARTETTLPQAVTGAPIAGLGAALVAISVPASAAYVPVPLTALQVRVHHLSAWCKRALASTPSSSLTHRPAQARTMPSSSQPRAV